jgi:hypothetical protein
MESDRLAEHRATVRSELEAFNEERARLLRGVPPVGNEERMPLERTGVGGDVD